MPGHSKSPPRAQLAAVATPDIGGVRVRRHVLEVETERIMNLVRKVGYRLRHWLRTMPEDRVAMRFDRETNTHYPVLDPNGNPLTEPLVPDKDWLENAEWYSKTMLGLLKEQRERARLAPKDGALAIDDATLEAELDALTIERIKTMPEEEFRKLLAERAIEVQPAEPAAPVETDDDTI